MSGTRYNVNTPISEKLADLTPTQEGMLNVLVQSYMDRVAAIDRYANAIQKCIDAGISYAMMGRKLGITREAVFRSMQRARKKRGANS